MTAPPSTGAVSSVHGPGEVFPPRRSAGAGGPGPRERAWLAAYPDRRRLLAARRRRLERSLFLEEERDTAFRRVGTASWLLALGGLALVLSGLPARADLAFLAGAVLFALGGIGLVARRAGEAGRRERRRRLEERLTRTVRAGDEMDARARALAAPLGLDPWEAAFRFGVEGRPDRDDG